VAEYQCKKCRRMLCTVCAKGAKKGVCRRCIRKREAREGKILGFCRECHDSSTEARTFRGVLVNGVGMSCLGWREHCERCNSVVGTLWFRLFFFPVFPIRSYRVLQKGESGVFSSANYLFRGVPMTTARLWPTVLWMPIGLAIVVAIIVNYLRKP
jgi:hypothetical protein